MLALVAAAIAVAWHSTTYSAEASALIGFRPSGLIHPVWDLPSFASDYPSGEAETLKSLVGQLIHAAGYLPLSDLVIVRASILLEFAVLCFGVFVLASTLHPGSTFGDRAAAALLIAASALVNADIARWGHPYYGSAYYVAYGFGLAGAGWILSGKLKSGGAMIGLAVAAHPIIGLLFGLFSGAVVLSDFRRYGFRSTAAGAAISFAIGGAWLLLFVGRAEIGASAVPSDTFLQLTRMMSYHWFPVSLGVFTSISDQSVLPILGVLAISAAYLFRGGQTPTGAIRQMTFGILALALLVGVGVWASEYSASPILIKLALHRATLPLLMVLATYFVPLMMADFRNGPLPLSVAAACLLLVSFNTSYSLPNLLSLVFAGAIIVTYGGLHFPKRFELVVLGFIAVAIAILDLLSARGYVPELFANPYSGFESLTAPFMLAAILVLLASRVAGARVLAPAVFGALAIYASQKLIPLRNPDQLSKARAFEEVQLWAKANTPEDALFMLDPGHAYGWREQSRRPSFGTLREWLYSGWIYDTRADILEIGINRSKMVNINIDEYYKGRASNPSNGYALMARDASSFYNSRDASWFDAMASDNNISYFVFEKSSLEIAPYINPAFDNSHYVVFKPASIVDAAHKN